jgi:hypothetical protein
MISQDINREQLCLVFRLGLERCQQNLAHLHALIHTGGIGEGDGVIPAALVTLLASLEKELRTGHEWLEQLAA